MQEVWDTIDTILLMGTVARNADIYKYPIYNFLESRLFYWTIYNFAVMRKEGIYTLFETLSSLIRLWLVLGRLPLVKYIK